MATKMDSAEKAFEAATLETAAKPVATPVAPAVAAPVPEKTKTKQRPRRSRLPPPPKDSRP